MNPDAAIAGIYAAANGRRSWPEALNELADLLKLWTVQVLGIDKRRGHPIFSAHGGYAPPQAALDYFRTYHVMDPRVSLAMSVPVGEWVHCHEHFDERFVAQSAFYQEFLIPHGGRWVSITSVIDNDDVRFMVGFMRGQGASPVQPDEMELLHRVRLHMSEALQNAVHLRQTYAELGMTRELLSQFNHPMLLVDETRGIWHRNPAAQTLLERKGLVEERNGFLLGLDRASDEALTEAVHGLALGDTTPQATREKRVVNLRSVQGVRHLAFVSAVRPHQTMGAFGHVSQALVMFHCPSAEQPVLDPFIVAECFDLTPAEARVAVQIASGLNAKEVARNTGVAVSTVRTQIQSAMEKAGVDRQADLIRALLALPVRNGHS